MRLVIRINLVILMLIVSWQAVASPSATRSLPTKFDSLGPTVKELSMPNGRRVHYIDDGEPGWRTVVLNGGLGTSVRVLRLLDFLKSMRHDLSIRVVTVERNGFGQTDFDPDLNMDDYATEVESVLSHLGIERFVLFGISGGGPYSEKIAARNPTRLISIHLAATSPLVGDGKDCASSPASQYRDLLRSPRQYFGFPAESPVHGVEGFQDTAFDEASRAHFVRGQMADLAPLDHEIGLYCSEGDIDTSKVDAPVYIYHGLDDGVLSLDNVAVWKDEFEAAEVFIRRYPGEGHDVQYRHLDQILLDIAGFGDQILVCRDGVNNMVEPAAVAPRDSLGLCAWR